MIYTIIESIVETNASVEDIEMVVGKLKNEYGAWCVYDLITELKKQGYYVNDNYDYDEDDALAPKPMDLGY